MANKTNNYKFPKPDADDFYDISEYNKAMDILDDSLTEMNQKKLDKNGDASEAVTEFEQEILRENIESGETLSSTFGKIKKWFAEMKDVAFSGHAKDVTTDAAHRFVSDTEKSNWNGKVGASGGDISGTLIETLEPIYTKYPIPDVGDPTKVFMGKVKKHIVDVRPLDADMMVYVATTGSDTTGSGTSTKPFKTIKDALDIVPNDLNGYKVSIIIANGTYSEHLLIKGYKGGTFEIVLTGDISVDSVTIDSTNIICRSSDTNTHMLTTQYLFVKGSGRFDAWNTINITTTGFIADIPYTPKKTSICANRGDIYISGNVTLTGNTDVAVCILSISRAYIYAISGTGFDLGIFISTCSEFTCNKNNISAKTPKTIPASTLVSPYGAIIGTLTYGLELFVSTKGNDTTGNGAADKPFKTIQYALDTIPKDLGGYNATISIIDGTYDELLDVIGFMNGVLTVRRQSSSSQLNTLCKVRRISARHCTARVQFYGICLFESNTPHSAFLATNCSYVVVAYCQAIEMAPEAFGFDFIYSNGAIDGCRCLNKSDSLRVYVSNILSMNWSSDSLGRNYGSIADGGLIKKLNTQPSGSINKELSITGGYFINQNGTQISDIISSGLSCNWGTIQGGYIRHGRLNGIAVIIVNLHINVTSTLAAYGSYNVIGLPKPLGISSIAVSTNAPSRTYHCALDTSGILQFAPNVTVEANIEWRDFSIMYLTDS